MIQSRTILGALLLVALTGCGPGSDPAAIIENRRVDVSGEQVTITPDQVLCGEREGLWKIQQDTSGGRGRLTPAGRALGFADDVVMGDTRFTDPYAQISGAQQLRVANVTQVTDNDPSTRTVTASVGVVIPNACFDGPLPMHGAEGGGFSQQAAPQVRLRNNSGWTVDRILH